MAGRPVEKRSTISFDSNPGPILIKNLTPGERERDKKETKTKKKKSEGLHRNESITSRAANPHHQRIMHNPSVHPSYFTIFIRFHDFPFFVIRNFPIIFFFFSGRLPLNQETQRHREPESTNHDLLSDLTSRETS